jgi:hypothetical protein
MRLTTTARSSVSLPAPASRLRKRSRRDRGQWLGDKEGLGHFCAPNGRQDLARGFNRRALKGRKIEHINNTRILCSDTMPQSLPLALLHIVFSTKKRIPLSINRAVLLALIVGTSSIYAAPHEAQRPADNNRHLRIIQTSTSFVHTEFSGTLGIAELQKRFHPGGLSTKDPGQNNGPVFWLSADTDSGSWKENIVATTFWIGEAARSGCPSNTRSAWDSGWMAHYGGEDSPTQRIDLLPLGLPRARILFTSRFPTAMSATVIPNLKPRRLSRGLKVHSLKTDVQF